MKTDRTRLAVYLPPQLKDQFRELAFDKRMSQSKLALKVLTEYLQHERAEEAGA